VKEVAVSRTKVLFLALDAIEKDLVRAWTDDGSLPTLKMLLGRGLRGSTFVPQGLSVAVWHTLFTGCTPGEHGRYYYDQLVPGTYKTRIMRPGEVAREPFWFDFSRAGVRLAVIDIPKTDVTGAVNGLHLVDWASHDPDFRERPRSWPQGAADEATLRFGGDPVAANDFGGRGPSDATSFRDGLLRNIERRTRFYEALLTEQDWDLVFGSFDDGHQVGHLCWSIHDPNHARHDPALAAAIGDPIKDVYIALDRAVGRVLAAVGPEALVFAYSSTGMGTSNTGYGLLDPILCRLQGVSERRGRLHAAVKARWDKLPRTIQERFNRLKSTSREAILASGRATRDCFAIPMNDDGGAIRINLIGREPLGRVRPEDYDRFCDDLANDLMSVVNAETGAPILRGVIKSRDVHAGARVDDLPDLLMDWNAEAPIRAATSPKVGVVHQTLSPSRTGRHLPEGWLAVIGPGVPTGTLNRVVPITDFVPTLARALGVPGTTGGSFMRELFGH
jgi:predicted AlkP superfamily phosphohydrolase/phosphomutase